MSERPARSANDDDDRHHHRSPWLTFGLAASVAAILISVVVDAVNIAHEIGAMHRQVDLNAVRIEALEQRGSGPVQQSAERVSQLQARVDRILAELLDTQKRMGELATAQARLDQQLRGDRP